MSETNGYATAAELFAKPLARRFTDVEVCKKKFRLRSWTAEEAQKYISDNEKKPHTINERIIVGVVVDGEGNPIFSQADVSKLCQMDSAFIAQLSKLCWRHVGIEALSDLEDEEKNSAAT